jgi:GH43 family beta-xylosidase
MSNSASRLIAGQTGPEHRSRRLAVALAALGGLAVVSVVVALLIVPAGHSSASAQPPAHASHTVVAPPTTIAPPPPNPQPLSPGMPVGSDQYESDPLLYLSHGHYYLYTSGIPGSRAINVPVASATTFGDWTPSTDALPVLPPWAVPDFTWAPDIHQFGSSYVLYFTALVKGTSPAMQCIGAATGTSPVGPFTAEATPFICQTDQGGTIDPRVFTDSDGTRWMLFKSDQNIGGANAPTKMWSQRLTSDGLGLIGQPALLMQPDEPWQGTIVEAPDMVKVGGSYWMVYSGNWFNQTDYAIGMARCAGPAGPCADTSPTPLLGSNAQGVGPGEASLYQDQSGVWLLYSPWRSLAPQPDIPPRPVFITKLGFSPGGPYLAAGGPPPNLEPRRPSPPRSTP